MLPSQVSPGGGGAEPEEPELSAPIATERGECLASRLSSMQQRRIQSFYGVAVELFAVLAQLLQPLARNPAERFINPPELREQHDRESRLHGDISEQGPIQMRVLTEQQSQVARPAQIRAAARINRVSADMYDIRFWRHDVDGPALQFNRSRIRTEGFGRQLEIRQEKRPAV